MNKITSCFSKNTEKSFRMKHPKAIFVFLTVATLAWLLASLPETEGRAEPVSAEKEQLLKRGAQVYKSRCLVCHGDQGNSPNARMRLSDKEWKHGEKPEDVEKVVSEGIKGTVMIGFKNKLPKEDIKAVSTYVLALGEKAK
jgi:cytochrome c oxidase cbb3-type subunit III